MKVLLANLSNRNGSSRCGMPARYRVTSAWRRCSPSSIVDRCLRPASHAVRRSRPAASAQTVNSGASKFRFEQTSCSSTSPRRKLVTVRRHFASSAGSSQAAANLSAGSHSPPQFFHEFLNSPRFPHSRYTSRLSRSSGKWGRVTEDSWRVACFGESR
jgi:hypothetical protein